MKQAASRRSQCVPGAVRIEASLCPLGIVTAMHNETFCGSQPLSTAKFLPKLLTYELFCEGLDMPYLRQREIFRRVVDPAKKIR